MFENLVNEVAEEMHRDRHTLARADALAAKAVQTRPPRQTRTRAYRQRAAIAKALQMLAARLAPPAYDPSPEHRTISQVPR